jgi:hypothetical protein
MLVLAASTAPQNEGLIGASVEVPRVAHGYELGYDEVSEVASCGLVRSVGRPGRYQRAKNFGSEAGTCTMLPY